MNDNIKNWQKLWHEKKTSSFDVNELIKQLNRVEKKGKIERIFMILVFPITILALLILFPVIESTCYFLSVICIGTGLFMILLQSYKSKFKQINDIDSFDNKDFIKIHIAKLKEKMRTTSKYMWIYTILLICGLNFGYVEAIKELDFSIRIIIHIILSGLILWFMYSGIRKRSKKNSEELLPLIDKLESIEKQIARA